MVENLKWGQDKVSWFFESLKEINIKNVFMATLIKDKQLIYIEAGEKFIANQVYYFTYNGELVLFYDKCYGTIEWNYNGEVMKYKSENLKQVGYYPQDKKLLILNIIENEDRLLGLDFAKNVLFESSMPIGYRIQYLSEINLMPVAVCEGDSNHIDKFGRSRMNFFIDLNSGKMEKGNIAY